MRPSRERRRLQSVAPFQPIVVLLNRDVVSSVEQELLDWVLPERNLPWRVPRIWLQSVFCLPSIGRPQLTPPLGLSVFDTDCASASCGAFSMTCQNLAGGTCSTGSDCSTGLCTGGRCQRASVAQPCGMSACLPNVLTSAHTYNSAYSTDCQSGLCNGSQCGAYAGGACLSDWDCTTGSCQSGKCSSSTLGDNCCEFFKWMLLLLWPNHRLADSSTDCSSGLLCGTGLLCVSTGGGTCYSDNDCSTTYCLSENTCNVVYLGGNCCEVSMPRP